MFVRRHALIVVGAVLASVLAAAPAQAYSRGFVPVEVMPMYPTRVLDTRTDAAGSNDASTVGAGETRRVVLNAGVPLGASAVQLGITAVNATEATNLTLWPAGHPRPYTTSLLVGPDEVRSSTVIVELGEMSAIDLYNASGAVDVIVDVLGWFTGDFTGMRPVRVIDTRYSYGATLVQAGTDQNVTIGGRFGIPADARAVAMNVIAVSPSEPTGVLMWPAGGEKPTVPTMVVASDGAHTQSVIVGLGSGALALAATAGSVQVIVDVTGWFRADGTFMPSTSQQVMDTATSLCGVALGPGETRTFPVTGAADVFAVSLLVRAQDATQDTFLSVWAAGGPQPTSSTLNASPTIGPVATAIITDLGPGGQISVFNAAGSVNVAIAVTGTFTGTTPAGEATPCPTPPPPPPTTTAPAVTTTKPAVSWQTTMLEAINTERTAAGLQPVVMCKALNKSAQGYADVLITTHDISHTSPDGSDLRKRVSNAGYLNWKAVGENLAAGQGNVQAVMQAWMKSDGHRANILKPEYSHVGFGRARGLYLTNTEESWFWVQNFGTGGSC